MAVDIQKVLFVSVAETAVLVLGLMFVAPMVIPYLGGVAQPVPIADIVGQGVTILVIMAAKNYATAMGWLKSIGLKP